MRMQSYMEFIWYRALAEMRVDISRGFLGFTWWIIEPVLYMGTFYVIFGFISAAGRGLCVFPALRSCGMEVVREFGAERLNVHNAQHVAEHGRTPGDKGELCAW